MSGDAYLGVRKEYSQRELEREMLRDDPIEQLRQWLDEAQAADILEPNALCLSTVSREGRPGARMVLLRGLDSRGLTFYTNYESRKGVELAENPCAAMTFWWGALERQVRVEGRVERVPDKDSDAYFASRPYESQVASAASPQSQVIESRAELEARMAALRDAYSESIPRPATWGGFLLIPDAFEFWQGRAARTHDRFIYQREGTAWRIERLAP